MADKKWERVFLVLYMVFRNSNQFSKKAGKQYVSCNFQALNLMQEFNNKKSEKSNLREKLKKIYLSNQLKG